MGDDEGAVALGPGLEEGDSVGAGQEADPVAVGPGDVEGSKVARGPLEDQEIAALWKLGLEKLGRGGGALGQQRPGVLELGDGQGIRAGAEDGGSGELGLLAPTRALEPLRKGESRGDSQRHLGLLFGL